MKVSVREVQHRWEDNIKMDLQEMECGGMDWIPLAQEMNKGLALVSSVMIFGFHKMREFLD